MRWTSTSTAFGSAALAIAAKSNKVSTLDRMNNLSRQDRADDFAVDVGQAHVAATGAEGQPFVVDAEQVQHGRVQVVDLDLVAHGLVAPLVGLAVGDAALHAAAGQPDGE